MATKRPTNRSRLQQRLVMSVPTGTGFGASETTYPHSQAGLEPGLTQDARPCGIAKPNGIPSGASFDLCGVVVRGSYRKDSQRLSSGCVVRFAASNSNNVVAAREASLLERHPDESVVLLKGRHCPMLILASADGVRRRAWGRPADSEFSILGRACPWEPAGLCTSFESVEARTEREYAETGECCSVECLEHCIDILRREHEALLARGFGQRCDGQLGS